MTDSNINKTGTEMFQSYLKRHSEDVRSSAAKNYYHVDVVAEAFTEGFNAGEKSGKKEFVKDLVKNRVEELTQKAHQVYILTNRVVDFLEKRGYKSESFFINIFHENPKVILVVDNSLLLNDEFIELAYGKIFDFKRIFNDLFNVVLDMGIAGSDDLIKESLVDDGFDYYEELDDDSEE